MELFAEMKPATLVQQKLPFDTEEITDERFWEQAEDLILDALKDYADVRWAIGTLKTGRVGVITSRSFLLAPRLEAFRSEPNWMKSKAGRPRPPFRSSLGTRWWEKWFLRSAKPNRERQEPRIDGLRCLGSPGPQDGSPPLSWHGCLCFCPQREGAGHGVAGLLKILTYHVVGFYSESPLSATS